ncbi:MAG: HNH endonuclease [Deltaproteobacteria bacterium]|nr:HNH endonuclease [Deltaproteobacteria bacterium]
MAYSDDELRAIYRKTDGKCHLCWRVIRYALYGAYAERHGWEVDHSNPRAKGGTNRRSNLVAACCSCNRTKRASSTRGARKRNGVSTRRPKSRNEKRATRRKNKAIGGTLGAAIGGAAFGPVGALLCGLVGAAIGNDVNPE